MNRVENGDRTSFVRAEVGGDADYESEQQECSSHWRFSSRGLTLVLR